MSEGKKTKILRLTDDLEKQVQSEAKNKNISENDLFLDALRHYFICSKLEPDQRMRQIVLQYQDHCLKCHRLVDVGEWALYGRGVGVICLDCFVQRVGDKTLVAKYLKMREYEQIITALKNEADRLAGKVEIYGLADKWDSLMQGGTKIRQLIMDYLTKNLGSDEEKRVLEEFVRLEEKQTDLVRQIESFLEKQTLRAKKQIKQAPYEA